MSLSVQIAAERAFRLAARARRRASLTSLLLRRRSECAALAVHDERRLPRTGGFGVREIPLDAITATVEPHRAFHFDRAFRPARSARARWQRVWIAEHLGAALPPISVIQIGDTYAIRDGHHRVSVAKARGAVTIAAVVNAH